MVIYLVDMIRSPAVAGQFYPAPPRELEQAVRRLTRDIPEKIHAKAILVPHAGYIYSGAVAGEVFSTVDIPSSHVVFCPNHTGMGAEAAVMSNGAWRMPWGDVPIDEGLAVRLLAASLILTEDDLAHAREHSLEVQLPFIRRFRESFRFVPIALGGLSISDCRSLGDSAAKVLREDPSPPLLIASSDMSHYETDAIARDKDQSAISRILALDPEGLYSIVKSRRITMCGVIPTIVVMFAAMSLGATEARLIKYSTSGDVSGNRRNVVGYAGMVIL